MPKPPSASPGDPHEDSLPAAGALSSAQAADIAAMSFEDALAELESIVQKLERGQLDLDSAIRSYERGTQLRLHCTAKLREAEMRVEKLSFDSSGRASLQPLDPV